MGDDSLTETIGDTTGGEFFPRVPLFAGVPTPSSGPAAVVTIFFDNQKVRIKHSKCRAGIVARGGGGKRWSYAGEAW